jgi:hypothetical protein
MVYDVVNPVEALENVLTKDVVPGPAFKENSFSAYVVVEGYEAGGNITDGLDFQKYYKALTIRFQDGPIKEEGINGLTNEVLLAILLDRMGGFQAGDYKCHDNQMAMDSMQTAMLYLHKRTMDRMARNVEGTNTK